ncbi:MAG: cell division protein FtsL [Clostridia bacterium]|nr:cell division protein FtsL [Clostridia bacterium]
MNIFKINKIMNLILIVLVVYSIFTFVNQQATLNSYKEDISHYSAQIEELKEKEEELLATQENVNSEEYIEKVAREELDMYLPNEIVFVDISK